MILFLLLLLPTSFADSFCEKALTETYQKKSLSPKKELANYKAWKAAKKPCLAGHGIPQKLLQELNYEPVFFPLEGKKCPLKSYFSDTRELVVCSESRVVYQDGKFAGDFLDEMVMQMKLYNQSAPTVK